MNEDWRIRNARDWQQIHTDIFGDSIPSHCEWTNPDAIISVLNKIGHYDSSNHMFFPDGGGMDLESAKRSSEDRCIEMHAGIDYILRPNKLVYEHIDDSLEWSYFRIETDPIALSGAYENYSADAYIEEVLELREGHYVNRAYWDANEYNGEPLPESSRVVMRLLKGALVIFKKSSIYNGNTKTYDGRHETLGADGFKKHITAASAAFAARAQEQ